MRLRGIELCELCQVETQKRDAAWAVAREAVLDAVQHEETTVGAIAERLRRSESDVREHLEGLPHIEIAADGTVRADEWGRWWALGLIEADKSKLMSWRQRIEKIEDLVRSIPVHDPLATLDAVDARRKQVSPTMNRIAVLVRPAELEIRRLLERAGRKLRDVSRHAKKGTHRYWVWDGGTSALTWLAEPLARCPDYGCEPCVADALRDLEVLAPHSGPPRLKDVLRRRLRMGPATKPELIRAAREAGCNATSDRSVSNELKSIRARSGRGPGACWELPPADE